MSKAFTVAWREFKQTVLRPIFIIAVLGIPVLIIGVMAVAIILTVQNKQPPLVGTIAVVDPTGDVIEATRVEFGEAQLERDQAEQIEQIVEDAQQGLEQKGRLSDLGGTTSPPSLARGEVNVDIEAITAGDEPTIEALRERVRNGALIAAAVVRPEVVEIPGPDSAGPKRFELYVGETLDGDHARLIERRIGQAVVRVRAERANLDPDQAMAMLRRPQANTSRTSRSGEVTDENEGVRVLKELIPMVFMMLMWVSTFTSGQHLLMSTIEEKSNRVMEVLLSAVSPLQLMTGKILGHGAVGLLIALIYSSVAIAGLVIASFFHVVEPMDLVYFVIFFFMAYFMVASLMAAVGSAVSDIREANTLVTPVMLIMMVPWMLWMPISQAPNGGLALAFSFIPPAAPFAMVLRLAAEEPVPGWQIPVTIVWGYLCMVAMVWMAAKIFRVGVLMTGKPPTPLELIRWLRYS